MKKNFLKGVMATFVICGSLFSAMSCKENVDPNGYVDTLINDVDILNDEEINFYGRYTHKTINEKEYVYFGFTCTGFELYVDVKENTNNIKVDFYSEMFGHSTQYIKVYVDDDNGRVIELVEGEQNVTLVENLEVGEHVIKVLKMTEASVSKLGVRNLTSIGMDFYSRKYNTRRKKVEFYGDSLTCGYGNLGDPSSTTFYTNEEDGTLTYAYQAALEIGYDASLIAWSGIALSEKLAPYGAEMMSRYDTVEGEIEYDMSKDQIDLVVFNLGSNDSAGYDNLSEEDRALGIEEFKQNYHTIFERIKTTSPQAKIVSLYNMANNIKTALVDAIKEVTNEFNEMYGENTAHYIKCIPNGSGSNGHPNLIGHETTKEKLVKYLEDNNLI